MLNTVSSGPTTLENTFNSVHSRFLKFDTSVGSFIIELYTSHAPITCQHFQQLALDGYYNDTLIHTIQPNHVVIGGDPTNTAKGGTPFDGYLNELATSRLKHTGAGIIGMCENSQFYITLAPTPWNDGKYGVFGRVKKGMNVIKAISKIPTGNKQNTIMGGNVEEEGTTPLEDITIHSIVEVSEDEIK
ncbi:hypothetical protein C9374_012549 [Naegleria lovaniensis]|uniref:Peptidyl-prolyl cis-trans isomerase n=1 Tax=Naegleria lovaniensis TaxID=51637 RepID=A0AA88H368_NAELO|nr:uncharacterized protein C9374_012549 [Naegleria lovaniensis]KAG2392297.1 hypothetical protein C9374_012549 [Naegleria lovaniensis]